jgi:hypothetical protein
MQTPEYVLAEYGTLMEALHSDDRSASSFLFRVPHDWTVIPRIWLGVVIPATVAQIVSAITGLIFAGCIARRAGERMPLAFFLASVWMTVFGPATEIPTYTLLGPAAAWWAVRERSLRSMFIVVLLAAPILRGMFPASELLSCRSAAPLGGLLLMLDVLRPVAVKAFEPTSHILTARVATTVERTESTDKMYT